MINVPVRVKDALRSGDYKKNYKIAVYKWQKYYNPVYSVVGPPRWGIDFETPAEDGYYKIYVNNPDISFQFVRYDWDHEPYTYNSTSNYYQSYVVCRIDDDDTDFFIFYDDETYPDAEFFIAYQTDEYAWDKAFEIDNNNLVSESVKFDERMCSDTELKFGLCEGTSVEFQYFSFPNIRGDRININLDVQYKKPNGSLDWYTIPMGWFDVGECSRQASTGIIKATAYNKLNSDYLDVSIKSDIISSIEAGEGGSNEKIAIGVILEDYLAGYQGTSQVPITPDAGPISGAAGVIYTFQIYDKVGREGTASNYWLSVYCKPILLSINNVSLTEYYRFEVQCDQLCDYLENYSLHNPVTNEDMSPLDFVVHWVGYKPTEDVPTPFGDLVTVKEGLSGDMLAPSEPQKIMRYILRYKELPETPGERIALDRRIYKDGYENKTDITTWYTFLKTEETKVSTGGSVPCGGPVFYLPTVWTTSYFAPGTSPGPDYDPFTTAQKEAAETAAVTLVESYSQAFRMALGAIERTEITMDEALSLQNVTLRDLQSAVFESECKYGKLNRETDLFEGIELNNTRLYPSNTLYPSDTLYPSGTAEGGYPSLYSKLWADEGNVRSFRYLNITYKTTETIDGQEQTVEKVLQRTINANGTDDYNMSDNWLFKNLVWTESKVGDYADAMVTKMQGIRWFPFEMWCAGLPFLEAGDEIEIAMSEGTYPSYILRRTLSGIQNLQDELIDGTLDIF